MIVGSGVDVVDIARLARVLGRRGGAFERRVYTEREVRACRDSPRPARAFALRFAAKEAALKALGSGWGQGVGFRDVEVVEGRMVLHGPAASRAASRAAPSGMGGARTHLALAAGRSRALALVLLEAP
jgi:holo-[acyl-carrier protein] synthase